MIELRTLGCLDLRYTDGRQVRSILAQPKRLALLAYLAVAAPGGFVRRDTLVGIFWPESDDERARGAFRQAVLYLRRSLGDGVLVNRAEDELGIADGTIRCDVAELRAALERRDAECAVELFRGDLLAGLSVAHAPEFERWLAAERVALRAQVADAAWTLANAAAVEGDADAAIKWSRRGVELAPLDEIGVRRRMELLAGAGDRAGAVSVYEELAQRLTRELELEPSPETRALLAELRRREREVVLPAGRSPTASLPTRKLHHAAAPPRPVPARPGPFPAPRRRRSSAGRIAVAGAAAMLALTGLAYVVMVHGSEAALEPRRVVVVPFANRTGDPALDPVANMAADWIIHGLAGRGALEVVPVTAALAAALYLAAPADRVGSEPDP
jgi:DNA-binding SARP family transcriptional activator